MQIQVLNTVFRLANAFRRIFVIAPRHGTHGTRKIKGTALITRPRGKNGP